MLAASRATQLRGPCRTGVLVWGGSYMMLYGRLGIARRLAGWEHDEEKRRTIKPV